MYYAVKEKVMFTDDLEKIGYTTSWSLFSLSSIKRN